MSTHMLSAEQQRALILEARHCCDDRTASRFARDIDKLSLQRVVAFSTRNSVRSELKSLGHQLPPRLR